MADKRSQTKKVKTKVKKVTIRNGRKNPKQPKPKSLGEPSGPIGIKKPKPISWKMKLGSPSKQSWNTSENRKTLRLIPAGPIFRVTK
jgi:hypothetical protein